MIDFHTHTKASDGSLSPEELIELSARLGIRTIAVTDHDCINGVSTAVARGRELKIDVIPGIELSAEISQGEVHILGYFPGVSNPSLEEPLENLRRERWIRIEKIIRKLDQLGFKIEIPHTFTPGRPHVAQALVSAGIVKDTKTAFEKFLAKDMPCYVPRKKLSAESAVQMIRSVGGIAVWAHPGAREGFTEIFDKMLETGIEGLEVFHPNHSHHIADYLHREARRCGLLATAGSDFHGKNHGPSPTPGMPGIPEDILEDAKKIQDRLGIASCL